MKTHKFLFTAFTILFLHGAEMLAHAPSQTNPIQPTVLQHAKVVHPMDEVSVYCNLKGTLLVSDAKNRAYFKAKTGKLVVFNAAGAAGTHAISVIDKSGKSVVLGTFILEAPSEINDGGKYAELFNSCYKGMTDMKEPSAVYWNGSKYRYFESWDLDNNNVLNGMQYFLPFGAEYTDLLRQTQRPDGMIWSFVRTGQEESHYFETAYSPIDCFKSYGDTWFVRQPVDNHSDYSYVNQFYKHWKASGNIQWMTQTIASAALALDYCMTDTIRWSKRFQLLKRPYCIDSWDFQVSDEYTPAAPVSPTMVIVPGKTKYGVFFGDNTGYYEACTQLAEMYEVLGQSDKAQRYRLRAENILKNLLKVAWNGRFFTHFIDEDSTVKRHLGVDEKAQIAQGNMYSINRGLPHEINVAILKTYQQLKEKLPVGSPGEWYAIYPPFEKGFEGHNGKWQYMNGGVAGHAIGELARGAYENGYEAYGSDILSRLCTLVKKYDNKIYFSYTGSIPTKPTPSTFRPVDLSGVANMDLWDIGDKTVAKWMNDSRAGNDMRGLPTGLNTFNGIQFNVIDPEKAQRKALLTISVNGNLPSKAEVSVNDTASCIYLMHSTAGVKAKKIASLISFVYMDGSMVSKYISNDTDVAGWWFPNLKTEKSGIAWKGPNPVCTSVGVCWMAIDNPQPTKKISKLLFNASAEGGIYALLAISLANKPHFVEPKAVSFGGPDTWSAANSMAALVEGLAGVKNASVAFETVNLSPRWTSADVDSVDATIRYAVSNGYIAYKYLHHAKLKQITLRVTGSGSLANMHVLMPAEASKVTLVTVNNNPVAFHPSNVEKSMYADFKIDLPQIQEVCITYE